LQATARSPAAVNVAMTAFIVLYIYISVHA
jgi:hypothetical protein